MGKIPFMKGKTLALYNKYLSGGRFSKVLESTIGPDGKEKALTETLAAYTLNSTYKTDFIFDQTDISPTTQFNEKEWILLGMLLRAYKEIENISQMHLYNCFYQGRSDTLYGHIVTGRVYTLYCQSTNLVKLKMYVEGDKPVVKTLYSTHVAAPYQFTAPTGESGLEKLIEVELEFYGGSWLPSTLVEGQYQGLKGNQCLPGDLVAEIMQPGEYSSKLVEFFAGTLITPLSDPELKRISYSRVANQGGLNTQENIALATPGYHNKDGYIDRRLDLSNG